MTSSSARARRRRLFASCLSGLRTSTCSTKAVLSSTNIAVTSVRRPQDGAGDACQRGGRAHAAERSTRESTEICLALAGTLRMERTAAKIEGRNAHNRGEEPHMKTRSPQHRISRVIPVVSFAAALLVICCSSASTAAPMPSSSKQSTPGLAGTWSGRYSGAVSGTFTLRWTQSGSTLRGSIKLSNPPGRYPITGTVHSGKISFGAVGVGATYTGTVSGRSMSGRWKSANRGGTWSARKTS